MGFMTLLVVMSPGIRKCESTANVRMEMERRGPWLSMLGVQTSSVLPCHWLEQKLMRGAVDSGIKHWQAWKQSRSTC